MVSPMYYIERTYSFSAGHQLHHHDGPCKRPHGHSYRLGIFLRGQKIENEGHKTNMLLDFMDVDKFVAPMIEEYFDHRWINDTLDTDSPSSEFIAHWIYKHLKPKLPLLYRVSVSETSRSKAVYEEDLDSTE